jgi:hypothetical protein
VICVCAINATVSEELNLLKLYRGWFQADVLVAVESDRRRKLSAEEESNKDE